MHSDMERHPEPSGSRDWKIVSRDPHLTVRRAPLKVSDPASGDDQRFEREFLESILARDPCNEDVLMQLGHAYTRSGEFEKGLSMDLRLVRLRPNDAVAHYNLACSYSLLGRVEEALAEIEKAISLGYSDLRHMLNDPDLEQLRKTPGFQRLIRRVLGSEAKDS